MGATVTITIDEKQYTVPAGAKLLWAALDSGVYIPHLCGIRESGRPSASCRLCFVEIDGYLNPVTSCAVDVKDGMVVRTRSQRVDRLIDTGFELLMSNHRLACAKCTKNGSCELQKIARERGLKLKPRRLKSLVNEDTPIDDSPEKFSFDPTRCVLCGQCVFADHEKAGVGAIGFIRRGMARRVSTFGEARLADSRCTQCTQCVDVCPVGALTYKE